MGMTCNADNIDMEVSEDRETWYHFSGPEGFACAFECHARTEVKTVSSLIGGA